MLLVDYLTVLPATGEPAPPIADDVADLVRALAAGLGEATAAAARAEDVTLVRARSASTTHHAWSADPWVSGPSLPLPRRPVAFHPNEAGMTAVADLVLAALDPARE